MMSVVTLIKRNQKANHLFLQHVFYSYLSPHLGLPFNSWSIMVTQKTVVLRATYIVSSWTIPPGTYRTSTGSKKDLSQDAIPRMPLDQHHTSVSEEGQHHGAWTPKVP
jgi:hypothetical protein